MHFMIYVLLFVRLLFGITVSEKCDREFDVHLNSIILTHVSERNGAKFIQKIPAESLEQCLDYCCNTPACTAGVFGSKRDSSCYLFNCLEPNICNFTSGLNYAVFLRRAAPTTIFALHSVEDWPPGTLRGQCGPQNPCVGENTICDSGQCACKTGFIEKRRLCVPSLCRRPELQFQCDDDSACIAIYDVCNGIAECRDSSDEVSCSKASSARVITTTATPPEVPRAVLTRKMDSAAFSQRKLKNHGILKQPEEELGGSEFEIGSPRHYPLNTMRLGSYLPTRRPYNYKRDYFARPFLAPLGSDLPDLPLREPQQKSNFIDRDYIDFLERPQLQLHEGPPVHFLDALQYHDSEAVPDNHPSVISDLIPHSRYAALRSQIEDEDIHTSKADRQLMFGPKKRPLWKHSNPKAKIRHQDVEKHFSSEKEDMARPSTKPAAISVSQSSYQWHTAAIILAVGLGLKSCLFGLLVGRCGRQGCCDRRRPRSNSYAANHLRRRILRARGLPNGDLEKNGLLSKLQL